MAVQAADIFVSYKAEDRARLEPLVEALEAEGFALWWDAHIGGGTNWQKDIEENLDAARCVIVAWSKRSTGDDGHFVRDEARRAQRRGAYLPVCLDAVEPPLGFGEIQALTLKGWKGERSDPRYRALVDAINLRLDDKRVVHHSAHRAVRKISRRSLVAGGIGIGAIAATGAGSWLLLKPTAANARRIAVLPFANLSGDPAQAYFSDGIAEELRSALTRVGMEVIGRTSSDAVKDMDAKAAAAKLGVANILTGSVRRSSETIRIEAQLVAGSDGVERWAHTYDRSPGDAIKIQTDIAENVAQALSIALGQAGRSALALGSTADSAAQDLILQSRQLGRGGDSADVFRRRIALAEAAIARDPRYADAYVEKANAFTSLLINYTNTSADAAYQLAQATTAARKAVALAPKLGAAHSALALIALASLDFTNTLRETRESLALSPQDPDVLAYGSRNLATLGSGEEAVRVADRGIALDPLNARFYRYKSEAFIYLRRYPQAIEAGRKALELAPELRNAHISVGDAFLLLGRPDLARAEYEAIGADNQFRLKRLALIPARAGDRAGTERIIAQSKQQYGPVSYQYSEVYAQLADKDRAFAALDDSMSVKNSGLVYLKVDPFLDPIRGDPRYAALLRKLNFP